ncbi:MAG: glycosyl hydrolase 2 galactose-binding domain-containing protein [bacterium]
METISLNGKWKLFRADQEQSYPATVPGCVHTDLINAGEIEDPFYRNNEEKIFWIGEVDWFYRRKFNITSDFLHKKQIKLRCRGLDTLARITLNGQETW